MFSAVRGKKGMLHRLSHLSLILWKNASSSLSLLKWKNFALSGVFVIDLFSLTFDWRASSGSIWPPVDESSSGFMCWTGLEVWNGSLSQWTGNLLAGACFDWIRGLLNHTFFLNRMGILLGSCEIKNWLEYNQNNSHIFLHCKALKKWFLTFSGVFGWRTLVAFKKRNKVVNEQCDA